MKKFFLFILIIESIATFSQNIDIEILRDINLNRNRTFDNTFRGITNSAGPIAFGVPVFLLGVSLTRKDSILRKKAIYIGTSVVSAAIVSTILKYTVNRPRPYDIYPYLEKVTAGGGFSFPSGHTSDAFALATSLSICYPKWYIIAPSFVWAGAVAYSRMDLGVHYPSDVLAGAIIGAGSAFLCYKGQQWLDHKRKR